MQKKQFLPFLTDDQGRSLDVDIPMINGGIVVTRPIPDPLNNSPEGWEENTIQWSRSKKYRGLLTSYITNLSFHFEGARILREYFYNKGVESVLFFIWLKLNQVFGAGMIHDTWYKGEPDLSTFKDGYEGVQVNIMEAGFLKDLNANENTTYEYTLADTDPDVVTLEHDGMEILNKFHYVVVGGQSDLPTNSTASFVFLSEEGADDTLDRKSQQYEEIGNIFDYTDFNTGSDNYFLKNISAADVTFRFFGKLGILCHENNTSPQTAVRVDLIKSSNPGVFLPPILLFNSPDPGEIITNDIDTNITLVPGEKLFLIVTVLSPNSAEFDFSFLDTSKLDIDFKGRKGKTVIPCLRVKSLGEKLCRSMSNDASGLLSDLLDNDVNTLVTSGDAIRGIVNPLLKTKYADYYKSVDAIKCIGFKIQDNFAKIESRYDFYSNASQILNLGTAKIPASGFVTSANDYIYDSVIVGYPDTSTQDVNGRFSFNTSVAYKSFVRKNQNQYDAMSIYKSDPFVIELLRINLDGKTTTDNQSDNNVFFIDAEKVYNDIVHDMTFFNNTTYNFGGIELLGLTGLNLVAGAKFTVTSGANTGSYIIGSVVDTGTDTYILLLNGFLFPTPGLQTGATITFNHYKLRRKAYASITGVPSPATVFNVELSPKRILMNHYRWIHSGLDHAEGTFLTYQTTDKNDGVVTTDGAGVVIREREDIAVSSLGEKVYIPYYLTMEVKSPYNLKQVMDANGTGYFGFVADGVTYNGFPEDIKSNDATLATQEYKLLATINNDFTKRSKAL